MYIQKIRGEERHCVEIHVVVVWMCDVVIVVVVVTKIQKQKYGYYKYFKYQKKSTKKIIQ